MTKINFYNNFIFETIASHIGLKIIDLRLFPMTQSVPKDDYKLFNLFDIIPDSGPLFHTNNGAPCFSSTYEELLQSQPESFTTKTAKINFNNPKYWLQPNTPVYTPSSADISDSVSRGGAFNFEFDSLDTPCINDVIYQSFSGFIANQPFLIFNKIAEANRFVFKLHFDKMALIPVRPSGWFSQAAFTQAFKSDGDGWVSGSGTTTWDNLFSDDGILKLICNGVLAVSGMVLEIQSFGKYDNVMLNALKSNKATSIWPFYLNVENLMQDYVLGTDESIKITSQTPSSEILLLAMEVAQISGHK